MAAVSVDAESPTPTIHDGTAIQRVVAERHGAQRARMGFKEREVRREFVILEEELRAAVQRRLPSLGAATLERRPGCRIQVVVAQQALPTGGDLSGVRIDQAANRGDKEGNGRREVAVDALAKVRFVHGHALGE